MKFKEIESNMDKMYMRNDGRHRIVGIMTEYADCTDRLTNRLEIPVLAKGQENASTGNFLTS